VVCALIAYLILGGDMLISWFALAGIAIDTLPKRALLVFVYALVLPVALSLPRDISFLGYVSTATVSCIVVYIAVMIYEAIVLVEGNGISPTARANKFDLDLFSTLAMFGMSFCLPCCVMPAIRTYNNQPRKRKIVTGVAMLTVAIFVLISGITGYALFGEEAEANVLKNFRDDDVLIVVVRAGFFIVVTCAYPIVLQTIQAAWSQVIYRNDYPAGLPGRSRAVVLAVSNAIPLGIAMFVPNAKAVLEVGGGLGGCLVDFVFPALLWIKESGRGWSDWRNALAILLAVFGLVCAVIATYLAIVGAIASFR
jgi:amino acid permease